MDDLLRRHLHLVWAAARRHVGPADADDVAQAVFLLLDRKIPDRKVLDRKVREARPVPIRGSLIGWLYRTTRLCAANLRKTNQRRRNHEQNAAMTHPHPSPQSPDLTDLLDSALEHLSPAERDAVLLRYLEEQSFAAAGQSLCISEDAARKRAERGLEKLRRYFAQQGYAVPAAAVVGLLATEAAVAVPAGLAASVTAAVSGAAAPSASALSIAEGVRIMMVWMKIKVAAMVCGLTLLVGTTGAVVAQRMAASVPAAVFATGRPGRHRACGTRGHRSPQGNRAAASCQCRKHRHMGGARHERVARAKGR